MAPCNCREAPNADSAGQKIDDSTTVLGDQGRAFRRVFEGAQKVLRQVFGMEMVELPTKDKLTKEEKKKGKHTPP